jgi:cardiolipin synthase
VEVRGPAVTDISRGFADAWAAAGPPLHDDELVSANELDRAGDIAVRVVPSVPRMGAIYRLDQLVAAMANETLWLTDAYFVGTSSYVQALRAAAFDGVDVRLLVPGTSDISTLVPFSRAGYRPLLEAGIRVFEWSGSMMHAKTAVADRKLGRVGSSNLNVASWIGNWEMDVIIEDEEFATKMYEQFLTDLQNTTEIVLNPRRRVRPITPRRRVRGQRGSAGRVAAGAIRIGNTVGAAITNSRALGPAEARVMLTSGIILTVIALLMFFFPKMIAVPLSIIGIWIALTLFYKSWRLKKLQDDATSSDRDVQRTKPHN